MDIAIVTGAETPLGLSLSQRLVRQGFRVYGIGNNFSKVTFADPQFVAKPVDLSDLSAVRAAIEQILEQEKSLDLLIHALDVTPGAAFEKLSVGNLEAVLKIGLMGPVLLTRLALPNLLRFRGQLINIIPANKSGAPSSAVNALIEGGLREMNRALFDQARDAGLRITNLILRQNAEPDGLEVRSSEQTHIDLEDVARVIEHLLDPNFANVPAELALHPRSSAHSTERLPDFPLPLDPYSEVVLPPRAYRPPEQPKIATQEKQKVERTIPYTDDEMEDKIAAAIEDFDAHPERYERSEPQQRDSQPKRGQRPEFGGDGGGGSSNKRRRGRRRGGRNRNRDRDSGESKPNAESQPSKVASNGPNQDGREGQSPPAKSGKEMDVNPKSSRRGGRAEGKPAENEQKQPGNEAKKKPEKKIKSAEKPTREDKPLKKVAAKKTAKKAAKKKTAKKALPKEVGKKKAAKKAAKKPAKKRIAKAAESGL